MTRIIDTNQLPLVSQNARAGLLYMDSANQDHLCVFRNHGPALYQRLASGHGTSFPAENIERIINSVLNSEITLRFIYVAKELCGEPMLAGVMTSFQTYDVRWNQNGKRQVFPLEHGEDFILDESLARWFRETTKSDVTPNGIGLGSAIISQQIIQATNDADFRGIAKDNEIGADNMAIQGAMRNNGADIGSIEDILVIQVRPDQVDLSNHIGMKIDIEYPHSRGNFFVQDENSFIAHWCSDNGEQQISMVFTRIPATSDPEPVVWTRVTSGLPPVS